ncbi:MAG: serine hydrolase [Bacteroidia bacterium]
MKTILRVLLLLCVFQTAKAQQFDPQLADKLQDTMDYYVGLFSNMKGMSASVYIPGEGLWEGTAGVSHSGQPITADMEFGIASNSKAFVATTMLLLQENNVLDLDDAISTWIPTHPNISGNITIRQLLNHTSGVADPFFAAPYFDTINNNSTRVFTPEEVLGWVGAPQFAPGTSYGYSNTNYVLAGMIADSATGYHISQLIRDSILTPLGLNETYYDVQETPTGPIAHRWWNSIDYNDTSTVGLNTAVGEAGALYSTSGNMAEWYRALFSGQVLNPASLAELTDFMPTQSASYDYGLGLARETTQGRTYWGHGGSTWGYRSKMIYDTCLSAVVCGLSNTFPSAVDGITFLLYRAVLNHYAPCELTTGAEENSLSSELKLYPNPVADELIIETGNGEFTFEISDATGQVVKKGTGKVKTQVETSDLAQGIYLVKLSTGNETAYRKLVKN